MAELVKWSGRGGIAFYIKSNSIRGVKDLNISVAAEVETNTNGGETFTKKKNSGGYEITMTAVLNEMLDDNIQTTALEMAEAARCADTGYFYTAGAKLFPAKFMMTSAKITGITMNCKGTWISCEVQLMLKQCSKFDGSISSPSSSGGSGGSQKQTTKTTASLTNVATAVGLAAGQTAKSAAAKAVVNTIKASGKKSDEVLKDASTRKTGGVANRAVGSKVNSKMYVCLK